MIAKYYRLFIIAFFLDAYTIAYLGENKYALTIGIILCGITICIEFFRIVSTKNTRILYQNRYIFFMLLWMSFVFIATPNRRFSSFFVFFFFTLLLALSYPTVSANYFDNIVKFFTKVGNVLAIYGIFQFVSRATLGTSGGKEFSLYNLYIENHMAQGFLWTASVVLGNLRVWRSNGIFREPSFFSQFLAINMLFLLIQMSTQDKNTRKRNVLWLAINLICFVCAFSGTGVIVLMFCGLCLLLDKRNGIRGKLLKSAIIAFVAIIITLFVVSLFIDTSRIFDVFTIFTNRYENELSASRSGNTSGATRFINGWYLLGDALKTNPFIGYGVIGHYALADIGRVLSARLGVLVSWASPIANFGSEFGLVGLILLTLMLKRLLNIGNSTNAYARLMFYAVFALMFTCTIFDTWWTILILLLNVNVKQAPKSRDELQISNLNVEKQHYALLRHNRKLQQLRGTQRPP